MRPTPESFRKAGASVAIAALLLLSAGCLYRMPIQQGNYLNPTQVAQLEVGMTRPQVSFLLGTPMVPNGFNTDRWDYYYYVDASRRFKPFTERLTVYFKDEKVERFERASSEVTATPPAAPSTTAATSAAPAETAAPAAPPEPTTQVP